MAVKVEIVNKIPFMVDEYIKRHGSTKTWLAKELGYNSKQAFEGAINSKNPTIETLAKFSSFFNCRIEDLVETVVYFGDDK
jgi:DNA-binding XRE family transcriptional regulator